MTPRWRGHGWRACSPPRRRLPSRRCPRSSTPARRPACHCSVPLDRLRVRRRPAVLRRLRVRRRPAVLRRLRVRRRPAVLRPPRVRRRPAVLHPPPAPHRRAPADVPGGPDRPPNGSWTSCGTCGRRRTGWSSRAGRRTHGWYPRWSPTPYEPPDSPRRTGAGTGPNPPSASRPHAVGLSWHSSISCAARRWATSDAAPTTPAGGFIWTPRRGRTGCGVWPGTVATATGCAAITSAGGPERHPDPAAARRSPRVVRRVCALVQRGVRDHGVNARVDTAEVPGHPCLPVRVRRLHDDAGADLAQDERPHMVRRCRASPRPIGRHHGPPSRGDRFEPRQSRIQASRRPGSRPGSMKYSTPKALANRSAGMDRNMPMSVVWLAWQASAARLTSTNSLTSTR